MKRGVSATGSQLLARSASVSTSCADSSAAANAVVVVPTYNERQNIALLIQAIHRFLPPMHVLVVDDNSPDGTAAEVLSLRATLGEKIALLSRSKKGGLAHAYAAGFKEALRCGHDFVIQMDADLSHDPSYLPDFLNQISSCDLVLGSRYLHGVNVVNWDFKRLVLSKMASLYTRLVTRLPFTDLTGGFKCWRRSTLGKINLDRIFSNGYLFQIEMTWKAYRQGARVSEIPIIFYERELGRSKIDARIILEAFWGVLTLPFRSYK